MVDSLNKRINFLNKVIEELKLENIETVHARIEEYGINNRNKFDITTSRAVSHLSNLLEFALPITKENGYFIALKGTLDEELNEAKNAIKELKVNLDEIIEFNLPYENSKRTILKFVKLSDNKKYPRKFSEIKKHRL